jgi:hypothetical protein
MALCRCPTRAILIRDVLKCREWSASVMAAVDDVIITADDARFIERFHGEGVESVEDEKDH